jgi:sugar lactone lactonase YvrE
MRGVVAKIFLASVFGRDVLCRLFLETVSHGKSVRQSAGVWAFSRSICRTAKVLIKDQVTPMLFRKLHVSTRTLLQLAVAMIFSAAAVGAASAANSGVAPLLVPYTVNVIAGTPQFATGTTTIPVGYFGESVQATPTLTTPTGAAVMDGPYVAAVDSVGNVYIADTGNYIIREVNAQTGLITTIAGVLPKGCSGSTCSLRTSGCANGVPAAGAAIGSHIEGIAVDSYGNVYFGDNTTSTVAVIYRGGAQVANFIKLVNPGGVAASGGSVQSGYVYFVAGTINLNSCAATTGTVDNTIAFENAAAPGSVPGASLHGVGLITVDSAGNIYVSDNSNSTTRVINTQATPQTFFQYTVQPGYIRSIVNCNAALTTGCPTATTTTTANTGINGPVNAIVFNSQYVSGEADAYGNIYQLNGTGGGTGVPGIYGAAAYAGGAPLTNLLTAEAPSLAASYGPAAGNAPAELPLTYGDSYIVIGNPSLTSSLPGEFVDQTATTNEDLDIRPQSMLPDNFGTFWFADHHYPEIERIDQYTSLATLAIRAGRATANITPINNNPASFTNPYYCVYGSTGSNLPWTQGPQTYDPEGDGCPSVLAYYSSSFSTANDGLGNIFFADTGDEIVRELQVGTTFPATTAGTTAAVTQAIQVHFNSSNPPQIGPAIPDGSDTGNTTTAFSIPAGAIPDFTINTTTPEFPMGSLINGSDSAYGNSTTTANFQLWAGLPTCTQLGVYPTAFNDADYDCLVYVTFKPTAPGVRQSQLQVTTANGSVYNFGLYGVGNGGQLAIDGGAATPIAVTGLGTPGQIAVAQSGTTYIADPSNNRVVVLPAGGGTQTTIGTGLSGPMGVAVDSAGNVVIADTGNNRVVKVNSITAVQTVLGNNVWISGDNSTNGNTPPPQYAFKAPQSVAVDKLNNVYVADTGNAAVVEIPSNIQLGGAVPLLAYAGAPKFVNPVSVAVDSKGNVYVADTKNPTSQIVELPPGGGDLITVPGSQFPTLLGAGLKSPAGVAVDAAGNVYVSDISENEVVEIPSATGPGSTPFALNFAGISTPGSLALDANGNLYVANTGSKQILFDNRQNPIVNFGNVPQGLASPAQPVCSNTTIEDGFNVGTTGAGCPLTITNIGNQPVTLTSPLTVVSGASNAAYTISSACTSPLPAGLTCQITATMKPTADNGQMETITVNGGPQTLSLMANGEQPVANVVLSAAYTGGTSTTTPTTGATATITATVTQPLIAGNTPTGSVTFTYVVDAANSNVNSCGSGGTQTVQLVGGVATFQIPTLAQGVQYTVSANYSGDTLNSANGATPLVITVPGIPVSASVTSTAAQLTFTYGGKPPVPVGTVTPTPPSGITVTFGSSALATTPIGTYPVVVSFSGAGACAYGFPASVYAGTNTPAAVTENPASLTYTIPNFSAQYGAANISYGANAVITGAVNGDGFGATFAPAQSSILNVGTYSVVPTVIGSDIGNYTVTATPSTLTVTKAPVTISVTAAKTSVANSASGVASAVYTLSVSTTVPSGKGIPTGSVTITDDFTPITSTGYGSPAAPVTSTVALTAGVATYTPTSTTPGIHQYGFAYSGDSNFQTSTITPTTACVPSAITANCLIVDNPDFTLTSNTGPVPIDPGVVPSGNGLVVEPNQNTAYPETAVLFVNAIQGFTGSVSLSCQPQNPSYVSCFMTPTSVCFASTSSAACTNTAATAATVVAVYTPATLPLGFKTSEVQTPGTKTILAFLPFGVLAFCLRRRRKLANALWMLIAIVAVGAGMSGCGGNQVAFYTPIPTGPQTVTVTATYIGNSTQPAATRTFAVPIEID